MQLHIHSSSSKVHVYVLVDRALLVLFRAGVPNIENLSVFMAPPSGVGGRKDVVPHCRVYHHTTSLFPYSAEAADDSETEDTPSWLSARTEKVCLCICVCWLNVNAYAVISSLLEDTVVFFVQANSALNQPSSSLSYVN